MNKPEAEPEFGPNGAVMNAPTMTPELEADYRREASAKQSLLRGLPFPLILLVLFLVHLVFKPSPGTIVLFYPLVAVVTIHLLERSGKRGG